MAWNRWYSFKSHIRSSLWTVPVVAILALMIAKRLAEALGRWMVSQGFYDLNSGFFGFDEAGASAILDRIFTLNLSCLVFTFGSLLVAIQVAGGQYTPRIIATTLLRDNVIRYIVGFFVFTMLWANRALVQVGTLEKVPQFQIFLAMVFGVASLIAFLVLIDYCAKLLRPVSLVGRIGEQGIEVIQGVYPAMTSDVAGPPPGGKKRKWSSWSWVSRSAADPAESGKKRGAPDRIIHHRAKSAVLLAVNLQQLVAEARRVDTLIEVVPQCGDFVAVDDPVFYLYGNADAVDDSGLRTLLAFGTERTVEQDPMFAFRILVDIALKALSPAINDPTTAVLAIDQLQRLLRLVGLRRLRAEELVDRDGRLRVIFRTPNWEDFVHITFREIRQCGAGSLQIARRLRALIENLNQTLPEHRHAALRVELDLLDRAIERRHLLAEDLALARIPDTQGLGQSSGSMARN